MNVGDIPTFSKGREFSTVCIKGEHPIIEVRTFFSFEFLEDKTFINKWFTGDDRDEDEFQILTKWHLSDTHLSDLEYIEQKAFKYLMVLRKLQSDVEQYSQYCTWISSNKHQVMFNFKRKILVIMMEFIEQPLSLSQLSLDVKNEIQVCRFLQEKSLIRYKYLDFRNRNKELDIATLCPKKLGIKESEDEEILQSWQYWRALHGLEKEGVPLEIWNLYYYVVSRIDIRYGDVWDVCGPAKGLSYWYDTFFDPLERAYQKAKIEPSENMFDVFAQEIEQIFIPFVQKQKKSKPVIKYPDPIQSQYSRQHINHNQTSSLSQFVVEDAWENVEVDVDTYTNDQNLEKHVHENRADKLFISAYSNNPEHVHSDNEGISSESIPSDNAQDHVQQNAQQNFVHVNMQDTSMYTKKIELILNRVQGDDFANKKIISTECNMLLWGTKTRDTDFTQYIRTMIWIICILLFILFLPGCEPKKKHMKYGKWIRNIESNFATVSVPKKTHTCVVNSQTINFAWTKVSPFGLPELVSLVQFDNIGGNPSIQFTNAQVQKLSEAYSIEVTVLDTTESHKTIIPIGKLASTEISIPFKNIVDQNVSVLLRILHGDRRPSTEICTDGCSVQMRVQAGSLVGIQESMLQVWNDERESWSPSKENCQSSEWNELATMLNNTVNQKRVFSNNLLSRKYVTYANPIPFQDCYANLQAMTIAYFGDTLSFPLSDRVERDSRFMLEHSPPNAYNTSCYTIIPKNLSATRYNIQDERTQDILYWYGFARATTLPEWQQQISTLPSLDSYSKEEAQSIVLNRLLYFTDLFEKDSKDEIVLPNFQTLSSSFVASKEFLASSQPLCIGNAIAEDNILSNSTKDKSYLHKNNHYTIKTLSAYQEIISQETKYADVYCSHAKHGATFVFAGIDMFTTDKLQKHPKDVLKEVEHWTKSIRTTDKTQFTQEVLTPLFCSYFTTNPIHNIHSLEQYKEYMLDNTVAQMIDKMEEMHVDCGLSTQDSALFYKTQLQHQYNSILQQELQHKGIAIVTKEIVKVFGITEDKNGLYPPPYNIDANTHTFWEVNCKPDLCTQYNQLKKEYDRTKYPNIHWYKDSCVYQESRTNPPYDNGKIRPFEISKLSSPSVGWNTLSFSCHTSDEIIPIKFVGTQSAGGTFIIGSNTPFHWGEKTNLGNTVEFNPLNSVGKYYGSVSIHPGQTYTIYVKGGNQIYYYSTSYLK